MTDANPIEDDQPETAPEPPDVSTPDETPEATETAPGDDALAPLEAEAVENRARRTAVDEVRYFPIQVLMASVLADLPAIGKSSQNEDEGYAFRSIDAAVNALNPLFAKYCVVPVPTVLKRKVEHRVNEQGVVWYVTHLKVRYRFYGPAGDHIDAVVWGEAMDLADKATSKAMTAAQKVALVQSFSIATKEARDDDADKRTPEKTFGSPRTQKDSDEGWWGGWRDRAELEEAYTPVQATARALSPDAQADLRHWREQNSVDLPPTKTQLPLLKAVVDLLAATHRAPPAAGAEPPNDHSAAPTPEPAGDVAQPEAVSAEPEAQPEPVEQPPAEPAAEEATVDLQPDAPQVAEVAPDPSPEPEPEPEPFDEPEAAPPAPAEAEPEPEELPADVDPEPPADSLECQGKYDGCSGAIEDENQKNMSLYRFRKPMCRNCMKEENKRSKAKAT